jgi:glucose/arabinose dehydrogenase
MKIALRSLALASLLFVLAALPLARCVVVNVPLLAPGEPLESGLLAERLSLPPGFAIAVYAEDLPGARMLRFTERGDLLVSLPKEGRIVLLERDGNGDGRPDGRRDILSGLNRPHGLDFHEGWLYVAETDAVGRIRFDAATRKLRGQYEYVVTGLPGGGNHWSRSLRFGPDGWMYVAVGSSCNVCEEEDPRRAALLRFRPDGSEAGIYADGLRNTVGFDWRPGTGELYGVDNGRDLLGDDLPPEELNRIEQGRFYGWPYAYGNRVRDPDFGEAHGDRIKASMPPVHELPAHSAPLGIAFLRGGHWPADYQGAALVTLHGSWNRSRKQGYEVVSLHFGPDGRIEERKFATGFEINDDVAGRPVDVAEGPDGAIYLSDDFADSVYRVSLRSAPPH